MVVGAVEWEFEMGRGDWITGILFWESIWLKNYRDFFLKYL